MISTITLAEIEAATRRYAQARAKLAECVAQVEDEVRMAKRRAMPSIKRALAEAQERRDEIRNLIAAAPELFVSPKSVIFHGIRIGWQKSRGSLTWDDDEVVCARIRKLLPEQADALIRIVERPLKTQLSQLPASDLRRLGIEVIDAGEEIVIRPVDGELDKLIERLIAAEEPGDA